MGYSIEANSIDKRLAFLKDHVYPLFSAGTTFTYTIDIPILSLLLLTIAIFTHVWSGNTCHLLNLILKQWVVCFAFCALANIFPDVYSFYCDMWMTFCWSHQTRGLSMHLQPLYPMVSTQPKLMFIVYDSCYCEGAKDFGCEFNAQKSMSTARIESNDLITVCEAQGIYHLHIFQYYDCCSF